MSENKKGFTAAQMRIIRKGLEAGLSMDAVKLYANPEFDAEKMQCISEALNNLSLEKVVLIAKPEYSLYLMHLLRVILQCAHRDQIEADPELIDYCIKNFDKLSYIGLESLNNLYHLPISYEQLSLILKSELNNQQLGVIKVAILKDNLSSEQLDILINKDFTPEEMMEVLFGFENGLSIEQVRLYAIPLLMKDKDEIDLRKELVDYIN